MRVPVLEFAPPMTGFDDVFNTFRLGLALSRKLKVGDIVFLMDKPHREVFGCAVVEAMHTGTLQDMAFEHATRNHNQKQSPAVDAPKRLIENMVKRYGPQMCHELKKVTVIYLRRDHASESFYYQKAA